MSNRRTHYATTSDGVTIGAAVHGEGPPLVFLQGVIGDGDIDWQALLPHLTGRFTCHLPSLRGRGLSADHPDLSIGRLAGDVLDYVESIDAPTGLVGWSLGGGLALVAASAEGDPVEGVVCVDPVMPALMEEHDQAALGGAVARTGGLAGEGKMMDAVRAFAGSLFNERDIAAAEDADYFEASARYVPSMLNFFQQQLEYEGPTPDDPAVLGRISAPVLVLHGSDATPHATAAARHVAEHAADARVQEIPGAGRHAAPLTDPEALAEEVVAFFEGLR